MSQVLWLEVPEGEQGGLDEGTSLSVVSNHPFLQVGGFNVPFVVSECVEINQSVVAGISLWNSLSISPLWKLMLSNTLIVVPGLSESIFGISCGLMSSINSENIKY